MHCVQQEWTRQNDQGDRHYVPFMQPHVIPTYLFHLPIYFLEKLFSSERVVSQVHVSYHRPTPRPAVYETSVACPGRQAITDRTPWTSVCFGSSRYLWPEDKPRAVYFECQKHFVGPVKWIWFRMYAEALVNVTAAQTPVDFKMVTPSTNRSPLKKRLELS